MSNLKKSIYFIVITIIAVLFLMMTLYFVKLNMAHYKVNYFNDTMKVNSMSVYNDGIYYYINDNGSIYELSNDNENKCLITETDITGISVLGNSIYYISHEKLFRYNIETKTVELLDDELGYRYISSDNQYIYALRFINGNFTNYRLFKINDDEKYEITMDDTNIDKDITIFQDGIYTYLYNNNSYKSFCGVVDENNNIIFRSNDQPNKNLLYFNEDIIIVSDENYNNLLSYNKSGTVENIVNIPEGYSYIPQNIYSDEKGVHMLIQSQKGYLAIGYYNLPQNRHRSDAIIKYDVENGRFDFIYETKNKYERIIGYKDDVIICLHHNNLYRINANTHKKESLGKINVSNAMFEMCGNKIFVWNDNKYYGAYDVNPKSQ